MTSAGETQPLQVAIVGSGPSGFYAAEALLRRRTDVQVDMFDRLPTPFGLVRGGVAPDHPKIKQVTLVYDKIARSPGFTFLGNVEIGRTVTIEQLRGAYHVVILASGASADRRLGIAGEDLAGSHTATEFVGWYNAHPDYRDRRFDFSGDCAVVIGQGNVAGDVARILATPVDDLRRTDIAEHALDALACSRIRDIYVIGRRGPAQIKFSPAELRELGQIRDCVALVAGDDLALGTACTAEISDGRGDDARKNVSLLRTFAAATATDSNRRIRFRFLETPVRINGSGRVESVTLARNRMEGPPFAQVAVATAQTFELPCSLVLRSVGYRGVAVPGLSFDERAGIIPNHKGRCLIGDDPIPGMYVTGWIKRGPVGIIGTNRADSVETVESIFEDLAKVRMAPKLGAAALRDALCAGGERIVSYGEWQRIDVAERGRGQARDKPREKYTLVSEMIAAIDAGAT
jgi:ferredoxin/flavodoxin---NADP+ reductase